MKKTGLITGLLLVTAALVAQTYPNPDFMNEVTAYRKDNNTLVRLEKGTSKMNTKTRLGGMGGAKSSYSIDDEKSSVRFSNIDNYSFVYWSGAGAVKTSTAADSTMRSNGVDPSMFSGMGMDPSQMITLYKLETSKGKREAVLMTNGGMNPFGKKKGSDKYSCSFRKVRDGYYEIVVDKHLPKGEYAFVMMMMGSIDQSSNVFAFGVD